MKELKETVELMQSKDYKERFVAEYFQQKIRYDKLSDFISKYLNKELDFKPTCPIELLKMQRYTMKINLDILEQRAMIEGVSLLSYLKVK